MLNMAVYLLIELGPICNSMAALLNRKFHISQISHSEILVPIRHIFHTNISHFEKFAHVVKLY